VRAVYGVCDNVQVPTTSMTPTTTRCLWDGLALLL
jgi:hypothetical protein